MRKILLLLTLIAVPSTCFAQFCPICPEVSSSGLGGTVRVEPGDTIRVKVCGTWVDLIVEKGPDGSTIINPGKGQFEIKCGDKPKEIETPKKQEF